MSFQFQSASLLPQHKLQLAIHFIFDADNSIVIAAGHKQTEQQNIADTRIFADEPKSLALKTEAMYYLGKVNDRDCVVWQLTQGQQLPQTLTALNLYQLLPFWDDASFAIIGRAAQIIYWHRNHRYCGSCGNITEYNEVETDHVRHCKLCKISFYPRIAPCIIVIIHKNKELLLANGINHPDNMYSALAGFIEAGESIEDCLHREVKEEVNLKVHNIRYFGSQAWPFPHQLMLGFIAEYLDGEIKIDPKEINDAQWWPSESLPEFIPGDYSISGRLIKACAKQL